MWKDTSQPKPELTATALNSNIVILWKTVNQQPAPDYELDLWELQAAKLNSYWLPNPDSDWNVAGLLLLLLECGEQAACILSLSREWN